MRSKLGLNRYVKHIKVSEEDYNKLKSLKVENEPIGRVITLLLIQLQHIPIKSNIFYEVSQKYKKEVDNGIN